MFKLLPKNRLSDWKLFRNKLSQSTLSDAVSKTQELWQSCPFIPFYLDPENPKEWPDPWQLITENYYCDLAKTLGMLYTLHLTAHKDQLFPELRIYFNPTTRYYYHVVWLCQGKYVLNLIENKVVNKEHINQELKLIRCYTASNLKLEQY
jgi:hypothetical protein